MASDEQPRRERPVWSQRIVDARRRAGLSQVAVAEAIGRGQSTYAAYELGVSEPNIATFMRLGAVFSVEPAWLAFGVGEPTQDNPMAFSALERHKNDKLFSFAFTEAARMFAEEGLHNDLAYLSAYTLSLLRKVEGANGVVGAQQRVTAAIEAERSQIRAELDDFRKKRL